MKQELRPKQAWWWALPMLMLTVTPACSDDDNVEADGGNEDPSAVVEPASTPLTVNSNSAELSTRVTNYRSMTRATRAEAYAMPAQPTITEADCQALTASDTWIETAASKPYCVPAGQSFTFGGFKNNTVYIFGDAVADLNTNIWEATFYVMPGGTLTLTSSSQTASVPVSIALYSYGTVKLDSKITTFYTQGVVSWTTAQPGVAAFIGDVDFSQANVQVNGGTMYVGGALKAKGTTLLTNGGTLVVGCDSYIDGDFNINGASTLDMRGNVEVSGTFYCSSGNEEVTMLPGTVLKAKELQLNNNEVRFTITEDQKYAYLVLGRLESNTTDLTSKLGGYFAIQCDEFQYGNGGPISTDPSTFEFLAQVRVNESSVTIPTSCPGSDTTTPTTPETPETPDTPDPTPDTPSADTTLVSISKVETDHTHDISSTGIDLANGKIYVSWHQRGNGYHGCVEIGQVEGDQCKLLQFFETPASESGQKFTDVTKYGQDFNHIMVDAAASRAYVVGNELRGGLLAYVDLNAEGLVDATSVSGQQLKYRRLWGGDGNCIIRNGDYLQVATTYGYETYLGSDITTRIARDTMPGRAKFIVKDNVNSRLVGMHYQTRTYTDSDLLIKAEDESDKTVETKADSKYLQQVNVTIDRFGIDDYRFEDRTDLFTSGLTVAPVNGKNVVAVDGTDIYLCRGAYGLSRINAAGQVETFQLSLIDGNLPRGYVNGCCVDNQYVYVAYGSAGLYVLDKSNLQHVVAKYTYSGGKSANFVKVDDNYIYVAYGQSGWQVFKLEIIEG